MWEEAKRTFHTITFYGNFINSFVEFFNSYTFHTITFYGNTVVRAMTWSIDKFFPHDYVLRKPLAYSLCSSSNDISELVFKVFSWNR
ncbi:hypothetical protein PYCH_00320 [Pyrococcus yayanosii CH1]|uniref:Uncharacterized protein n=1 Tax=Pyrococcus yayanosii (strain CH1 / JCM 16557) TaxID=529709 RepID=F8AFD8_PYRYC|nr:hypothetical protein PYCH_00320 [Pyrococcus yayanosii CH1]